MPKLTKRTIEALATPTRDLTIFDRDLPGFGLRLKPSGSRSFLVQYRNRAGRTRRLTLGAYGRLTADEARAMAKQLLAAVERGEDPSEQRFASLRAPTLEEFAARYLADYAETKKKPSSVAEDRKLLGVILPVFGKRKMADISRAEVARFHGSLAATPYQANHALALLSAMFNLAERWGVRPDASNPCRHVPRYPERQRHRFLSGEELARLGAVLAEEERQGLAVPVVAVRLLILTGCRLSEILHLAWAEVDFEHHCLRLKDSKTGPKVVPLGAAALELLAALSRLPDNPYILPGRWAGGSRNTLHSAWQRIRKLADLADVRLHDLRHTWASSGVSAGHSLPVLGAILGHRKPATTARYAHLADHPLRAAADQIAGDIAAALNGRPPGGGEVIAFRKP
ncbi:MAG TPA: tyrosine-type recombinase/integrase [Thermoanaerobaculia bacterium]|nr:tyrosine-type recombinase/integrase [Thermoanaerobaculia bacterium]